MIVLLLLGVFSFLFCLVLTPICRDIFHRAGLVDRPDAERKFHLQAVPRVGGIPIVISCAGSFALLYLFFGNRGRIYIQHGQLLHAVLPASTVIFAVGLIDDLIGLKPWQKLLGQTVAASLAIFFGVRLTTAHMPPLIGVMASFIWLICCTNAVNLIDGMDGLATGVSLLTTLTALMVALMFGRYGLALATAPLAGALLAFLKYNFSPASVFLGDSGSLTVGFMLGCFGLVWSQHTESLIGLAAPLMALALPLTDVGLAIVRRFLRNAPIFQGDRGHIHHRILALGFSTSRAALILYGACCAGATMALVVTMDSRRLGWPMLAIFVLLMALGIKRLGYVEFSAARKLFSRFSLRRAVQEEIHLEELRTALSDAHTVEGSWHVVRIACRELQFSSAHLKVGGMSFYEEFSASDAAASCDIELTLGHQSWLVLTHSAEETSSRMSMAVLNQIQSAMRKKLSELQPSSMQVRAATTAA
ncbi:MAG: glycosyltransferase family 4 protein [Janthinobacterium lividum]